MEGSLWRNVIADLREDHRCVVPTLPLVAHRRPMNPNADLSLLGMARLVAEFLEELDLNGVTLVGNDWGGAQLLVSEGLDERVGRLVLAACEAFDNYPPGVPGRALARAASIPGGLYLAFQSLRLRPLRRLPLTWGWMSKRPVPDGVMDGWFRPLQTQKDIRRDLRKYALSIPPKKVLLEWFERLRSCDRPTLVVWAAEDRVMPREHGRRLAGLFPRGRLVEIPDSYTLIPEDQPGKPRPRHPRVRAGYTMRACAHLVSYRGSLCQPWSYTSVATLAAEFATARLQSRTSHGRPPLPRNDCDFRSELTCLKDVTALVAVSSQSLRPLSTHDGRTEKRLSARVRVIRRKATSCYGKDGEGGQQWRKTLEARQRERRPSTTVP